MQRVAFVQELNSKAAYAWRHMTGDQIYAGFVESGIAFEKLKHTAVPTVDESDVVHRDLPADHTKNLYTATITPAFLAWPSQKGAAFHRSWTCPDS